MSHYQPVITAALQSWRVRQIPLELLASVFDLSVEIGQRESRVSTGLVSVTGN
jgi:hypothetical protein